MIRKLALAAALVCLPLFAWSAVDTWDDGDPMPAEHGVLVFKIERERLKSTGAKRGAYSITLNKVGSDEKFVISNPARLRGYLLPAGRYYLYGLRDIDGGVSEARGISNPGRYFEVKAGFVSWAGVWKVAVGAESTQLAPSHPADDEEDVREEYEQAFAAGLLLKAFEGNGTDAFAAAAAN